MNHMMAFPAVCLLVMSAATAQAADTVTGPATAPIAVRAIVREMTQHAGDATYGAALTRPGTATEDEATTADIRLLAWHVVRAHHLDQQSRAEKDDAARTKLRQEMFDEGAAAVRCALKVYCRPILEDSALVELYGDASVYGSRLPKTAAVLYYRALRTRPDDPQRVATKLAWCYRTMLLNLPPKGQRDEALVAEFLVPPGAKDISEADIRSWNAMLAVLEDKEKAAYLLDSSDDGVQYAIQTLTEQYLLAWPNDIKKIPDLIAMWRTKAFADKGDRRLPCLAGLRTAGLTPSDVDLLDYCYQYARGADPRQLLEAIGKKPEAKTDSCYLFLLVPLARNSATNSV